ncbi:MAG: DUF997 family protein [Duodenibacillus sp.]|nr:DUF997 family protein [Duodenibacillus sp.]
MQTLSPEARAHRRAGRDALATLAAAAAVIAFWTAAGFGLAGCEATWLATPLWVWGGCVGTWLFATLAAWWLARRIGGEEEQA